MIDNELENLLDYLYAAVTDLERWYGFARRLDEFFQADVTHLVAYDLEMQGPIFSVCTNTRLEEIHMKLHHLPPEADPRYEVYIDLPEKPLTCSTSKDLVSSPEYFDVFREMNVEHHLGAMVPVGSKMHFALAMFRLRGRSPFTTVDCDRVGELIPHFKRAMLLRREIAALEEGRWAAMSALDQIPMGVVVVGMDASVLFANATARAMAHSLNGFVFRNDKIWGTSSEDTQRLHSEIRRVTNSVYDDAYTGDSTGIVQLTRTLGSALYVRVQAVIKGEDAFRKMDFTQPVGILFISDPDEPDETIPELLQRMFGLTPAESRLTESLVRGCDLKQTQTDLHISENTARTHLKSVFRKTDTSNQAELVKLVVTSPAWRKYPASERPTFDH
ncbi:MAG: hypothetical protein V2J55_21530 [Candidatus Competibacteraceae bacterium]|jgi:DNA-binding CsgD family transcriptional regulator|nr:hypothetical protein [Candidatus Competibacteraceae bacterium]